ncbi:hypothetical protein BMF94_0555 [Rhodotorula taiwanensis]|uniref:F-box domain-containing protein n=1 Tax=Rhodotorula taiwanensis TaxID=741276 RepID=A0A2S5BHV2_9BASI|nr:hypothetical protein BMF94_0555 [Rhodotorula taiwanensis]
MSRAAHARIVPLHSAPRTVAMTDKTSLLSLPDELLRAIVAGIDTPREQLHKVARVCRRLRSLAEEYLYESITLTSRYEQYELLLDAFQRRPRLRSFVKAPLMPISKISATIVTTLLQFPACTELSLMDFSQMTLDEIIGSSYLSRRVPKIQRLIIKADITKTYHETLPPSAWWCVLAAWPRLRDLELDIKGFWLASPGDGLGLSALRRLRLSAAMLPPHDAVFAETCPILDELSIGPIGTNSFTHHILSSGPSGLLCLAHPGKPVAIEQYIARYPQLKSIHIGPGFDPGLLLPLLAASQIEEMTFDRGSPAADDFLAGLLVGPQRMFNLRRVEVNHVIALARSGLYQKLVHDQSFILSGEIHTKAQAFRAEYRPQWPPGCTRAGLSRAVDLAEAAGVSLSGTAVSCINWDAEFDEQFERFLVMCALANDSLEALVAYYGEECAGDILIRHRPALAHLIVDAVRRRHGA